jgi:parallel beta-helix repeat protein
MFQSRSLFAFRRRSAVLSQPRRTLKRTALALTVPGALGVAGVFAPTASASPPTVTCGDTINTPGTYVLGADCSSTGFFGITITSSNVTLKLAGHTITAGGSRIAGVAVDDSAGAISGVAIKGPGTLTGFVGDGVILDVFGGPGISGSTVSGVTATNDAAGIVLGPTASVDTIIHNTANDNGLGINLLPATSGNTVNHNTANDNNSNGIQISIGATGNTVNNNTAQGNGKVSGRDLFDSNTGCDSNTWRHNTFNTANQACIR